MHLFLLLKSFNWPFIFLFNIQRGMSSISSELFFNEANFRIVIPNVTKEKDQKVDPIAILEAQPREFAFYDEHLQVYLLASISQQIAGTGNEVKDAVHSFYNRLDVTIDATFVDSIPSLQSTGLYRSNSLPTRSNTASNTPKAGTNQQQYQRRSVLSEVATPFFTQAYSRSSKDAMVLFEHDNSYCCLYPMLVPIVYAKTKSPNPSLSINYTLQYRPLPVKRASLLADQNATDDSEYDTSLFETINLLGGLAEDPVFTDNDRPLQRFMLGQQQRLSNTGSSASLNSASPNVNTAAANSQLSLKRNVRENLSIRSGLAVKMRTTNASVADKVIMMSVELENPADVNCEFLIDKVDVQVSNAVVTAAFQSSGQESNTPIHLNKSDLMVFVYNITLLEDGSVKPPTQQRMFPSRRPNQQQQQQQLTADDKLQPQRVSIQVVSCPVIDGKRALPMRSKWNTMLDVSGKYLQQQQQQQQKRESALLGDANSPTMTRSYDLNSVSSNGTSPALYSPGARSVIGSPGGPGHHSSLESVFELRKSLPPQPPPQQSAVVALQPSSPNTAFPPQHQHISQHMMTSGETPDGIVVSFTVPESIRMGKTFPLHIFIVNRSKHTRRFQVMIPNRKRHPANVHRPMMKTTLPPLPMDDLPADPYMSEPEFLKQYFENETHEADILCLENNVRLSPLGPSTSQSVDIQFIAVKDKLHTIDLVQLVDQDTGFVTNLRHILEIFVEP